MVRGCGVWGGIWGMWGLWGLCGRTGGPFRVGSRLGWKPGSAARPAARSSPGSPGAPARSARGGAAWAARLAGPQAPPGKLSASRGLARPVAVSSRRVFARGLAEKADLSIGRRRDKSCGDSPAELRRGLSDSDKLQRPRSPNLARPAGLS